MSDRVQKKVEFSPELQQLLQETLKSERQWLRVQRIQRAKYMASKASSADEKRLWTEVLRANSY